MNDELPQAVLRPIGTITSVLKTRREAPRQGSEGAPDAWIEVAPWAAQALHGLSAGDEIIVITWLHRARRDVFEVRVDDQNVRLTPSEFRLLTFLAEEPERVYSRREIMQHLWQSEYVGDERATDMHVSNLRRKIERDPDNPERVVTVRGIGYKLVPA